VLRQGMICLAVLAAALISSSALAATVLLNDGQAHQISDTTYEEDVIYVRDVGCGSVQDPDKTCGAPGDPTQLELLGTAIVDDIWCYDSSTITVTSGEVTRSTWAWGEGKLEIDGGAVNGGFYAYDNASITMSGGSVPTTSYLNDTTSLTMTGGYIYSLNAYHDSTFTLSGGNPSSVYALSRSHVEILGRDFMLDDEAIPCGPVEASSGWLTGTLESNEALSISITRDPEATITLVPEPRLALLHAFAAIGVAALARRRENQPRGSACGSAYTRG